MNDVIDIRRKKRFTIDEARTLVPIIRRFTENVAEQVRNLSYQYSSISDPAKRKELKERIENHFRDWYLKIEKLGGEAKGMWLVDFDSGEGYFCWNFPERELSHFHGYDEGFNRRVPIH